MKDFVTLDILYTEAEKVGVPLVEKKEESAWSGRSRHAQQANTLVLIYEKQGRFYAARLVTQVESYENQ